MRRAAHPSGCAKCGAGGGCLAIKYQSLFLYHQVYQDTEIKKPVVETTVVEKHVAQTHLLANKIVGVKRLHRRPFVGVSHPQSWSRFPIFGAIFIRFLSKVDKPCKN